MAQPNISPDTLKTHLRPSNNKMFDLPPIMTQSSLYFCSTWRKYFRNLWSKIDRNKSVLKNWHISSLRYDQIALALQRLKEEEVQNLEEKEQIIIRDGDHFSLLCNNKRSTKRRNRRRKDSGPQHQRRQGRLCFLFSMSFNCPFFFILTYPRTWASPQNLKHWK